MSRIVWISGCAFLVLLALVAVLSMDSGAYHRKEFLSLQTNFNHCRPSWRDRVRGIESNDAKHDRHLRRMLELGAVAHRAWLFTEVPYTAGSSRRIRLAACTNFPDAAHFSARHRTTNDPGYGPRFQKTWFSGGPVRDAQRERISGVPRAAAVSGTRPQV